MNLASFIVLGIVAVLFVFAVVSSGQKKTDECDGNCGACIYSCNKQEGMK